MKNEKKYLGFCIPKIWGNPEVVLLSDIIKHKPLISEEWVAEPSSHLKSQPHHHLGTFLRPILTHLREHYTTLKSLTYFGPRNKLFNPS